MRPFLHDALQHRVDRLAALRGRVQHQLEPVAVHPRLHLPKTRVGTQTRGGWWGWGGVGWWVRFSSERSVQSGVGVQALADLNERQLFAVRQQADRQVRPASRLLDVVGVEQNVAIQERARRR